MIFPWVDGLKSWNVAPITWTLIIINIFWFVLTLEPDPVKMMKVNKSDIRWILSIHERLLQADSIPAWLEESQIGSGSDEMAAFKLAMDPLFVKQITQIQDPVDPVGFQYRLQKLQAIQDELSHRKVAQYGFISRRSNRWATWVTYQFMHGGFLHLFSNMIMLLLFGAALEKRLGGGTLMGFYLLSGFAGGGLFYALDPHGIAPLVGASASVTGIIGAYLMLEKRAFIAFYYFLGVQNIGKIYLPSFVLFFYFFVDDLASWLASDPQLGSSVAHIAHLGGFACGIILVLFVKTLLSFQKRRLYAG